MQRNPEDLYELGPAVSGVAGAPMLHYLEGFIDAGTAGRLLAEHLLRAFPHETVARFDTDRLIDYRSRRPLMTYDNSRWESYDPPELALHLLHDQGGRPFLLLTGPEPDHEWDLFSRAVLSVATQLDTGPAISFLGIPAGMPHTRPLGGDRARHPRGAAGGSPAAAEPDPGARQRARPDRAAPRRGGPRRARLRRAGAALPGPGRLSAGRAGAARLGDHVDRARPARRRAPRGGRPHQRGDPAAGRGVGGGRGAGPRARAAVRHRDREPAGRRGRGHRDCWPTARPCPPRTSWPPSSSASWPRTRTGPIRPGPPGPGPGQPGGSLA